jgi:biotin-dependent carboxylase-like uncharacterized protein
VVSIGAPSAGVRSYVTVAGGIDTPEMLGSRSADVLSGIGGGPLTAGALLPIAGSTGSVAGSTSTAGTRLPVRGETTVLEIIAGPRLDWFSPTALATLCGSSYAVSPASNRTGLRLEGPSLPRLGDAELPSEGMVTGSVQVPHDGRPILLLTDHPTVGGYPVIAVVASADIGLAAQLRPGDQVRFSTAC